MSVSLHPYQNAVLDFYILIEVEHLLSLLAVLHTHARMHPVTYWLKSVTPFLKSNVCLLLFKLNCKSALHSKELTLFYMHCKYFPPIFDCFLTW